MPSILDELAFSIRDSRAILFVGAGLSMSVGLPSWQQLIEHMQAELKIEPGSAAAETSYQTLAEFYRLQYGSIGPLRSWMDRTWSVAEDRVRQSDAHELIVGLDFPIIYTTNYDANLEVAYRVHEKEFVKVMNARDVAKATGSATQIVKFHGDFEDDQSLVIAETDYFDRLSFESPLDIKFRADALGRTILFIGYSMSDLNIRLLLHRLWQTWRDAGYEKDRPRSFVFMHQRNPVQEAVLAQWGITVVSGDSDDPEEALKVFLARLKKRVDELRGGSGERAPARQPRRRAS
ncbi:MAG TPA: SIR2 family protein [Geminicoccaceae bacterium]|nr:SIR2 family protein [Geminicoccaceae bacterium]